MIQRIQTLFLLLTAIITGLMMYLPVAGIDIADAGTYNFYATKVMRVGEVSEFIGWNPYSYALTALITVLSISIVFLYKRTFLQLRLCIVNIILLLGLFVLMWIQVSNISEEFNAGYQLKIAFVFPPVGMILTWLALRGIFKDINILKSLDRLR